VSFAHYSRQTRVSFCHLRSFIYDTSNIYTTSQVVHKHHRQFIYHYNRHRQFKYYHIFITGSLNVTIHITYSPQNQIKSKISFTTTSCSQPQRQVNHMQNELVAPVLAEGPATTGMLIPQSAVAVVPLSAANPATEATPPRSRLRPCSRPGARRSLTRHQPHSRLMHPWAHYLG
jgi:hypothetical protein